MGRARVNVVAIAVAGIALAEDNAHQVVGAGLVIARLHGGRNFVVRLGHNLPQRDTGRVVAQGAKRKDLCHESFAVLGIVTRRKEAPLSGRTTSQRQGECIVKLEPSCGTIASKEVAMARNSSGGRGWFISLGRVVNLPVVDRNALHPVAKARWLLTVVAVVLLLFFASPSLTAQAGTEDDVHITPRTKPAETKKPAIDPSLDTHTRPFRARVDLVLVPVTITDPMNRLVTGLEKDNFQLFENKEKQEIRHFSSEDAPISLGVIFDVSGSMSNKIDRSKEAVVEFFKTANPQDEFFVVSFSEDRKSTRLNSSHMSIS